MTEKDLQYAGKCLCSFLSPNTSTPSYTFSTRPSENWNNLIIKHPEPQIYEFISVIKSKLNMNNLPDTTYSFPAKLLNESFIMSKSLSVPTGVIVLFHGGGIAYRGLFDKTGKSLLQKNKTKVILYDYVDQNTVLVRGPFDEKWIILGG